MARRKASRKPEQGANGSGQQTTPEQTQAKKEPGERKKKEFDRAMLDKTVIAIPLLEILEEKPNDLHSVIIDLNLEYSGQQANSGQAPLAGRLAAKQRARELIIEASNQVRQQSPQVSVPEKPINEAKSELSQQYLFAKLPGEVIRRLVQLNDPKSAPGAPAGRRAIYRIWPDFPIRGHITKSISTVKADAAQCSFSALGKDIVWAVLDSGIDGTHPHFADQQNLVLGPGLQHRDFAGEDKEQPLVDEYGHGTHVAGIIAGQAKAGNGQKLRGVARHRSENSDVTYMTFELETISGMAPRCKLLSLKVLNSEGQGEVSSIIAGLEYVQQLNGNGRRILVHGVNLSVGYEFDPEWFACGQSPLCAEVDRLVRSGVVVVVAAGNTGYGWLQGQDGRAVAAGMDLTINDPGNAELAITVGSTHRDMPHVYGVSYFSSKGPTGDGRLKPDLVAPGEKILSCAAGKHVKEMEGKVGASLLGSCRYVEDSGTSMAAPHVSGVIAAFLSVRREFIGQPEAVKKIFLENATDLKRTHHFQGAGLVDLMRAIQSV